MTIKIVDQSVFDFLSFLKTTGNRAAAEYLADDVAIITTVTTGHASVEFAITPQPIIHAGQTITITTTTPVASASISIGHNTVQCKHESIKKGTNRRERRYKGKRSKSSDGSECYLLDGAELPQACYKKIPRSIGQNRQHCGRGPP